MFTVGWEFPWLVTFGKHFPFPATTFSVLEHLLSCYNFINSYRYIHECLSASFVNYYYCQQYCILLYLFLRLELRTLQLISFKCECMTECIHTTPNRVVESNMHDVLAVPLSRPMLYPFFSQLHFFFANILTSVVCDWCPT